MKINAAKKGADWTDFAQCIQIILSDRDFGFVYKAEQDGVVVGIFATGFYWDYWFNGRRLNVQALELHPDCDKKAVLGGIKEAVNAHINSRNDIVGVYFFHKQKTPKEELKMLQDWFALKFAPWVVIKARSKL